MESKLDDVLSSQEVSTTPMTTFSSSQEKKRLGTPLRTEQSSKKQKIEKSPVAIRKQIEYYFSDENLRRDRFFHTKISEHPEGWLELKHILHCKKMQNMETTQEDIISAVAETHLETKIDTNNVAWIRRPTPLPELNLTEISRGGNKTNKTSRFGKGNDRPSKSSPKHPQDIHQFGCLVKVTGVPEEVSWTKIKEEMNTQLLKILGGESKIGRLRYVSPVTPEGEAFIYCSKFEDDVKLVPQIKTLEINGVNLNVALVEDVEVATEFFQKSLPLQIKKDRERQHMKLRTEMMTRPLMLAGSRFESVEHLRKCYRELLDATPLDTELKPTAYKVIRALLSYHPNALVKAKDVVAIKVSQRKDLSEPSKCFFLVRSDGTSEDFSMVKCVDALMKNPPFVVEGEQESTTMSSELSTPSDTGSPQQQEIAKVEQK